jgi:protein O-mannosyl-transferase
MSDHASERVKPVVFALAAALLAVLVFAPAVGGGWIYDDNPLIAENPYVHSVSWWPRWFVTDFWDVNEEIVRLGSRMVYWRPAVTASYAIDWQVSGGSPTYFHLVNLMYHAVVAALAFVVLRRWVGTTVPAFIAAILFAIHPTKAESVAWIAGRTDVLCMIAVLVASQGIARRLEGRRYGLLLEVVGTIAAYTCKEQAIVLPIFAVVETWISLGRPPLARQSVIAMIKGALPQAAIVIGYLGLRAAFMPIAAASSGAHLSPVDHAQSVLDTFGRFFTLTVAPHDLSIQQGLVQWQSGVLLHSTHYMIIGALGLALLCGLATYSRRRSPIVTVGIFFYLVTLLPTSNIRYTEMRTLVSERFLYLPIFGVALVVGALVARVPRSWHTRIYALVAAIALSAATITLSRSADFADEGRFWARERELHWDSREARSYELRKALNDKQYRKALKILLERKAVIDHYDPVDTEDVATAFLVAQTLSNLIPDNDATTLRAIDSFCADMLDDSRATAELVARDVRLGVTEKPRSYLRKLQHFVPQLLALRSSLHSRLGDDDTAQAFALQARAKCGTCTSVFIIDAVVHARAGRYDEAEALLAAIAGRVHEKPFESLRLTLAKAKAAHEEAERSQGPAKLRATAAELSLLEAWGRAYAVLAPYKAEIERVPGFAVGFAELAFRAGHSAVAREVLSRTMDASDIDTLLDEWTTKMGWAEAE